MSKESELTALIKSLSTQLDDLRLEVKHLSARTEEVPEDHLVSIAAAVAAYLGERGKSRQPRFPNSPVWASNTRRAQHAHHPLYSR
jgi:methylmalonyl-CoA carboxyltransferase large subunit